MKIFYLAPYCFGLEVSLANGFRAAGAEVDEHIYGIHNQDKGKTARRMYNIPGLSKKIKKLLDSIGVLNLLLARSLRKKNRELLEAARRFRPDVIFIVKGEILFPETLDALRRLAPLVSYHWDDPFLQYAKSTDGTSDIRYRNLAASYSRYDLTFVYDESYIEGLAKAGAKTALYLMDWYEPEIYRPLTLSAEEKKTWGADVAFVGSPYPNRVALLEAVQAFDVGVWGPEFRWKELFDKHPFLRKQYRGEAPGTSAVKIYNASKLSLNVHDSFQCFSSVNNRTFQILAAGGFELVDDRAKLHELFEVGKDLGVYTSLEDAARQTAYYLDHPVEREAARTSGRRKAGGHSATERAKLIVHEIEARVLKKRAAVSVS